MLPKAERLKGSLYIVAAALLWGFIGPFGKMAYDQGISPLEVAFWRAVLAWICFGAELFYRGKIIRTSRKDLPLLGLFSVLCITIFYGSYQVAVQETGAAMASVLLYTAPAWVIFLSRLLLAEPITRDKLLALILTIIGIICIAFGQSGINGPEIATTSLLGLCTGLLCGFCYSLYYILGKFFAGKYSASLLFFYTLLPGALLMLPFFSFTEKSPVAWLALVLLSVFSTYGAYHFYYAGLARIEAGRASLIATLEPVVAALAAWYWWGEYFTLSGYAGALLIILAVLSVVRK